MMFGFDGYNDTEVYCIAVTFIAVAAVPVPKYF